MFHLHCTHSQQQRRRFRSLPRNRIHSIRLENLKIFENFTEPTTEWVDSIPDCDLCMQIFEAGPEPGLQRVRRACAEKHQGPGFRRISKSIKLLK